MHADSQTLQALTAALQRRTRTRRENAKPDQPKKMGCTHLSEAYISELSGGQSQMVSVVQALIRRSEAYLFDEPTSALDLNHQLRVLNQIKSAVADRKAVGIVALHDLNLAARFADHLILIRQGRILAEGPPEEILQRPEIAETYDVDIHITTGPKEDLVVHAYPS